MNDMDAIAQRFKQIRMKNNMNQKQFAETLKVSQSVISDIERGYREPSRQVLVNLAAVYKVNLNWLLCDNSIEIIEFIDNNDNPKVKKLESQIAELEIKIKELKKENANLCKELLDRMRELLTLKTAEKNATR
ncbi:MAG: helix-turn-helix transcriptional regulator [Spirochaetales bacterium]|nr:helix-turn-helix transcriptional regulator [Spirochaetales bacterium]